MVVAVLVGVAVAAQAANVEATGTVARERGPPRRAVVIALATAQQESRLRNLDYGDRDSPGALPAAPVAGVGHPGAGARPRVRRRAVQRAAGPDARLAHRPADRGGASRAAQRLSRAHQQLEPMARALATVRDEDGQLTLRCT